MFVLFYCSCVLLLASTAEASSNDTLEDLFIQYGQKGQMNLTQLQEFLKTTGVPVSNKTAKKGCLSAEEFHGMYSKSDESVSKTEFKDLCPRVLFQLSKEECQGEKEEDIDSDEKEDPEKAWGYGFLFVTIICILCLLGALVVPIMNRQFYQIVLMCMVSLAVGVLLGSAIFHLIPSTLGFSKKDPGRNKFVGKLATFVGGFYLFFILEYSMKLYIRFKAMNQRPVVGELNKDDVKGVQAATIYANENNNHGHSHGIPNGCEIVEKPGEKKKIATVAWMIILGDSLHNFIDGLAIGASFSTSAVDGISTSLAIMAEELPHELGDFAILLNSGCTYKQAMLANFLSACMCYVGLMIGLVLGYETSAVKYIQGIAAGIFIYISLVDLLPESFQMTTTLSGNSKSRTLCMILLQNIFMLIGFGVMCILALDFTEITL